MDDLLYDTGYIALMFACSYLNNYKFITTGDNGHIDMVKFLINQKVDVNAQNIFGETALLLAARKGHSDIAKKLIANVNMKDKNGKSAVEIAQYSGNQDIIKLFEPKTTKTIRLMELSFYCVLIFTGICAVLHAITALLLGNLQYS